MNTFIADTAERSRPYRIVGVAAVLMAALVVGAMFVANASNRHQPTGGLPVGAITSPSASPTSSPDPSPVPGASPAVAPSPNPSPSVPPAANGFTCEATTTLTAKQPPLSAYIDGVRTGMHTGYDRLTIEFNNGQPGNIVLRPQNSATFNGGGGRGGTFTLAGRAGILVEMNSAHAYPTYAGPTDIKTGFAGLVELRQIEDFEGYVQWALGLSKTACYHAFILTNPTRLVIDIQTS